MMQIIKRIARNGLNGTLRVVDLEVVRIAKNTHDWSDATQFIPLEETLAGAREANLPLGEYIDAKHNVPGVTQETHDRLVALGVFNEKIDRVCEIGPGSGRFLEKTLRACKPSRFEIYETARDWSDWLVKTYRVIPQPADGATLAHTPSSSIDLVQAHKVFPCTLFMTTCSYFTEIVRVTRPGAWVVFDVMTETCMDDANVPLWLQKGTSRIYPAIMPKAFVENFFKWHGFRLIGSFVVPMKPGRTECFVFRRGTS
jgi:hypothetical protein